MCNSALAKQTMLAEDYLVCGKCGCVGWVETSLCMRGLQCQVCLHSWRPYSLSPLLYRTLGILCKPGSGGILWLCPVPTAPPTSRKQEAATT